MMNPFCRALPAWTRALTVLLCVSDLAAQEVPLKIDRGALEVSEGWPLGVGVPLKPGQVKDLGTLGIQSVRGAWLPVECEARVRYPDGSIQWLWADFQGPAEESYRLVPLRQGQPAFPKEVVQVSRRSNTLAVSNGVLQITWDTRFATPMTVECVAAGFARSTLANGDGAGIYLHDHQGRKAILGGAGADLDFQVETANRLRAVIRVEGWYVCGKTEQMARAVVRYHLYAGRPWMRIEHSFIVTRDNDLLSYREIGIRMPLAVGKNGKALFGVREGPAVAIALGEQAREAFMSQSAYPIYYKTASEFQAGRDGTVLRRGREAEGWCDLSNGLSGLVVAVEDFAPRFPKELAADARGVTAKLWSGRDGKILDYRPATLAREWWGDWTDRVDKVKQRDVGTLVSPEEVKASNPSCVGLARTHTLLVGYYVGAQDDQRARKWHARLERPPVVYPDPRWTCHVGSRTFWPMAAKGEGGPEYADLEAFIATWFDEFMAPLTVFPYTGWYDFGRLADLRYAKVPAEDNRIYAQWYRLSIVNNYLTTKYLMLGWARSGDRKILEAVQRANRWQMDFRVVHWGGGKQQRRAGHFLGGQHQLPYWDGRGGLRAGGDTELVTGPALEYLFRDNRWNRDTLELVQRTLNAEFQPTAGVMRDTPDMVLSAMLSLYRMNPDQTLRKHIHALYEVIADADAPAGLKEEYFAAIGGHYTAQYKINRKSMALIEYCDLFGDEQARLVAAKAAKAAARMPQPLHVCYYCELYGAANARVYQWTRDDACLEPVRYQVDALRKMFACYRQLPAEDRLISHFRSTVTTQYFFSETGLKDNKGQPLVLAFGRPSAATPFLSVPVAMWALQGCPDGE